MYNVILNWGNYWWKPKAVIPLQGKLNVANLWICVQIHKQAGRPNRKEKSENWGKGLLNTTFPLYLLLFKYQQHTFPFYNIFIVRVRNWNWRPDSQLDYFIWTINYGYHTLPRVDFGYCFINMRTEQRLK